MQPKISVIIPVYNVEAYLRRCLDSVVNQTLRELQILCVDHGSTDGSPAILREYADRDPRIEIISSENTGGGPGQARNAALPFIKGTYTYFVDSDDWLDLELCEKAYRQLEQSEADIVFFYHHCVVGEYTQQSRIPPKGKSKLLSKDAIRLLDYYPVPWNKIVRTSFMRKIQFRFPEGQLPEDHYYHWVLLVNEPRIELIQEELYYYYLRSDSQMGLKGEYVARHVQVCSKIKEYLIRTGKFPKYRELILKRKLESPVRGRGIVRPEFRPMLRKLALEYLEEDEIIFLRKKGSIIPRARDFYLEMLGDRSAWLRNRWRIIYDRCVKPIFQPIFNILKKFRKRRL